MVDVKVPVPVPVTSPVNVMVWSPVFTPDVFDNTPAFISVT